MQVDVVGADELDLEAYAALQHRVFSGLIREAGGDPDFLDAAFFAWKYHPPAGPARVALVRDAAGDPVAANAMFPLEVVGPGGERRRAWQSCDTATAPEARGQGHFMRCLGALVDDLEDGDWFFGFPNANSTRGFEKLGWVERGVVDTWARPVPPLGLSRPTLAVEDLDALPDAALEGVRLPTKGWSVHRSPAYLRWRYRHLDAEVRTLSEGGRAVGLGVHRVVPLMGRTLAVILELWGATAAHERRVLEGLVAAARGAGARGLVLLDSGRWIGRTPGLLPVPPSLLPKRQVLMGAGKRAGRMDGDAFPEAWRVQTGDWDGF
jgi:GNAT superfamily N-acetyltransferase